MPLLRRQYGGDEEVTIVKHCPPTVLTAEDLLRRFEQSGDAGSFAEIVRRYSGMVYGVCYRVTRNAHDAEDATQGVFLKLATQARTNNEIPRVGPWLQQVAKTTSVDLRRSRSRRQNREQIRAAIVEQEESYEDAPETACLDELKQKLRDEVDRLPVTYRTPLILYYFGGLSTEQIAVELKTNAKALAVRLFRGRKLLGSRLKDRGIVTAGGAVVTLAVADAILGTMASSVFHSAGPGGAAALGGGMSASASPWMTGHTAIINTIVEKVLCVTRVCALAGKWKVSVVVLLTVGSVLAGSSEIVQGSSIGRSVGGLLQKVGNLLRGGTGSLAPGTPKLRADADAALPKDESGSPGGVAYAYPINRAKPDSTPVKIVPLRRPALARSASVDSQNSSNDRQVATPATPVRRTSIAAKGSTTDLLPSASRTAIAINSSSRVTLTKGSATDRVSGLTSEQSANAESAILNKPSFALPDPWNRQLGDATRSKLGPIPSTSNGSMPVAKSAGTSNADGTSTGTTLASTGDSRISVGDQLSSITDSIGLSGTGSSSLKYSASTTNALIGGHVYAPTTNDSHQTDVTSTVASGGDNTMGIIDGTGLTTLLPVPLAPLPGTTDGTTPSNTSPLNASGTTVPEPGAIGLAGLAIGGLLARRRRKVSHP